MANVGIAGAAIAAITIAVLLQANRGRRSVAQFYDPPQPCLWIGRGGLRWIAFSRLLKILAEFLLKPRQGVEQRLKG